MAYNHQAHKNGTYADKRGAIRAAKRKLGKDAKEGVDYVIIQIGRWWFELGPKFNKPEEAAETQQPISEATND
jgi:hypothetical protein